jgi:hypothetical protein
VTVATGSRLVRGEIGGQPRGDRGSTVLFLYYQSWEEMEVLFTLLAERYERRSVLITSNLVFSK